MNSFNICKFIVDNNFGIINYNYEKLEVDNTIVITEHDGSYNIQVHTHEPFRFVVGEHDTLSPYFANIILFAEKEVIKTMIKTYEVSVIKNFLKLIVLI